MTPDLWALAWPILLTAGAFLGAGLLLGFLIYPRAARRVRGRHHRGF